jgi:hypothetical protein
VLFRSKPVLSLLVNRRVDSSHSRASLSGGKPFSGSQLKTLKLRPVSVGNSAGRLRTADNRPRILSEGIGIALKSHELMSKLPAILAAGSVLFAARAAAPAPK